MQCIVKSRKDFPIYVTYDNENLVIPPRGEIIVEQDLLTNYNKLDVVIVPC